METLRRMDFTKMDSEGRETALVRMSSEERPILSYPFLSPRMSLFEAARLQEVTQTLSTKVCLSQ